MKQSNTRSFVERKVRKLRLTTKSRPWVAAWRGILDSLSLAGAAQDDMDLCEEPVPDDDMEKILDAEEDDEFEDVFGGNVDMSGNDQEAGGEPPPAPASRVAYLDLEKDLEAVLNEDVPPAVVAREVLEHVILSGDSFGFVKSPEPEVDNRSLKEKLLDKWKAKKSGAVVIASQPSSSSGDTYRWWE